MKTTLHISLASYAAAVLFPGAIFAEEPRPSPSPAEAPFQMPDISKLSADMMSLAFTESIKPERAAQLARFQKLYYDALIKEGFSKEDALDIVKGAAFATNATK